MSCHPQTRSAHWVTSCDQTDIEALHGASNVITHGLYSLAQVVSPVALIHGPFGSGKSTLLVSIIRFLRQQVHVTPLGRRPCV